jgi:hypothetical protein
MTLVAMRGIGASGATGFLRHLLIRRRFVGGSGNTGVDHDIRALVGLINTRRADKNTGRGRGPHLAGWQLCNDKVSDVQIRLHVLVHVRIRLHPQFQKRFQVARVRLYVALPQFEMPTCAFAKQTSVGVSSGAVSSEDGRAYP